RPPRPPDPTCHQATRQSWPSAAEVRVLVHRGGRRGWLRMIVTMPGITAVARIAPVTGVATVARIAPPWMAMDVAVQSRHVDSTEAVAALVVDDPDVHHRPPRGTGGARSVHPRVSA